MSIKDYPRDLLRKAGWHSRGYLPHFDGRATTQTITLHLADSIPTKVVDRWENELRHLTDQHKLSIMKRRIDNYLDQGYGECFLRDPRIAKLAQDSLIKYDGVRYHLFAWCVMPNHEHSLMRRFDNTDLETIMQAHKSYTAHEANKLLHRKGEFWMKEYFDREIRNEEHFYNALRYIENNPVKAKLCAKPSDWAYSSAWFRERDGKAGAWVVEE